MITLPMTNLRRGSNDSEDEESPLIPSPRNLTPQQSFLDKWLGKMNSDLPLWKKLLFAFLGLSFVVFGLAGLIHLMTRKDFYAFSCNGWLREHPLPEDKARVGTFSTLSDENSRLLRQVFEAPYKKNPKLSPEEAKKDELLFDEIQSYYHSCLNESLIEQLGVQPLASFLKENVVKHIKEPFELSIATAKAHSLTARVFFVSDVVPDLKDPHTNLLAVGQAGLNLPSKEYYQDKEILALYEDAIVGVNRQLLPVLRGAPVTEKELVEEAKAIIEFEKKLASVSKSRAEMSDPEATYNPFKVHELGSLAFGDKFWSTYLEELYPRAKYNHVLNQTSTIIVDNPDFFRGAAKIIELTDQKVLSSYILWTFTNKFLARLSSAVRAPTDILREKVGMRPKNEPPRWETCLRLVDAAMGDVASKWFVETAFGASSKKAAEESIANIKTAFLERLPNIEWIDEPTRIKAVEKVESITTKIGFPDFILSPSKALDKYKNLQLKPNDFFNNFVASQVWQFDENKKELLKPVDFGKWEMSASTVNAYYNPPLNEIVFPAGILQSPFYNAKDPQYLNYGAIGAVVGHELTHAFDNNGRKFDSKGRLVDWWTNQTANEFESRAKCFEYQYGNYTVRIDGTEHHVDGKLTMGENLADAGGVARAYEAWKNENNPRKNWNLPGLKRFTQEQLFFVSFAQVWCARNKDSTMLRRLRTDPHSPENYRVNGVVVNSAEFSRAFKCERGRKMNPETKCLICEADCFGKQKGARSIDLFLERAGRKEMRKENGSLVERWLVGPKLLYFTMYMSFFSCYAFRPKYLYVTQGIQTKDYGILAAALSLVSSLSGYFWSQLVDRIGHFRPNLVISAVLAAASFQLFLIKFPEDSKVALATVVSSVYIFFLVGALPVLDAFVMAYLGKDRDLYGRQRLWGTIAYAVISLIVSYVPLKPTVNILIVALTILYVICVLVFVRDPPKEDLSNSSKKQERGGIKLLFTNPNFLFLMVVVFMNGLGRAVMTHFNEPIQRNVFKSPSYITGYCVVVSSFFELVALFFGKQLIQGLGVRRMLLIGQVTTVMRVCLYGFMPRNFALAKYAPLGVSIAFVHLASVSWVTEIAPQNLKATALSIYSGLFMGFAPFCGGVLGWFVQTLDYPDHLQTEEERIEEEVTRSILLLRITAYVSIAAMVLFFVKYVVIDEWIHKKDKHVSSSARKEEEKKSTRNMESCKSDPVGIKEPEKCA